MLALSKNLNKEKVVNLNIPSISRIEFWRVGSPPGKLFISDKKVITDPTLLAKIIELLNGELEEVPGFDSPPDYPTHILGVFPADNSEPKVLEFVMGEVIDDRLDAYIYLESESCRGRELWDILEREMFGQILWSPNTQTPTPA